MPRVVHCVKLGRDLPGLEKPPVSGELGRRIYEHISAEAYEMWKSQMTLLINHYGLSPADPEARQMLREAMEEFFFGEGAPMPEGWTPEGGPGPMGKGGPGPMGKGGGAPARK